MKKIAFLFPGQGSQYVGMGKDFYGVFAVARETFEEADEILKTGLSKIIFEGPEDVLTQTRHSQLAIFITSMAILRVIAEQMPDIKPFICAGLSLGEYTALCASDRLGFQDTLLLVKERAHFMNEVCDRIPGTMAAILGLNAEDVAKTIENIEGVWVANYNCPGQTVISGTKEGVEKGSQALKARGAKRAIPLTVHGAFHSELMLEAQNALSPFIAAAPIRESKIAFAMNVPGTLASQTADVKRFLTSQVTQSVRWEQSVNAMEIQKIDLYLEIGCGKALSAMNKKIGVKAMTLSVEKLVDLDELSKQIEGIAKCSC